MRVEKQRFGDANFSGDEIILTGQFLLLDHQPRFKYQAINNVIVKIDKVKKIYWWFAYDVVKNVIMQIMINLS